MAASINASQALAGFRGDAASRLWLYAVSAGVAAGILFTIVPALDLLAARYFFDSEGRFAGDSGWAGLFRNLFRTVFFLTALLAVTGLVRTIAFERTWLGLDKARWLYLALCLAAGPGLVANVAFKNEWGRARPVQITEFGGSKTFSPPLTPSDQCATNCSFVSGEASSIFAVFFAAAFLFRKKSSTLIRTGVAAGAAAGLVRMAQGGHFLSDVIFAGVFMALTAVILDRLFAIVLAARGDSAFAIPGAADR